MSQTFSKWFLGCLIALVALQAIPVIGPLPILLGVALLAGFVAELLLVAIVFDVALGTIAPTAILLPIFVYGGYFGALIWQNVEIPIERRSLQLNNPVAAMAFDPNENSLVVPIGLAEGLVAEYAVPVVYEFDPFSQPEGYSSYRLLSEAGCQVAKDALARARSTGRDSKALHDEVIDRRDGQDSVCILRLTEAPQEAKVVVAMHGGADPFDPPTAPAETVYDFSLAGQDFATYRTAGVGRLPFLPEFWIGCLPRGMRTYAHCGVGAVQPYEEIASTPAGVEAGPKPSPIAVTLGLQRRQADELQRLRAAEDGGEVSSTIASVLQRHIDMTNNPEEAIWARVALYLTNPDSGVATYAFPTEGFAFLPKWGGRFAPYASALVANYVALAADPKQLGNSWRLALLRALTVLPRSAYAQLSDAEVKSLYDAVRAIAGDKWVKDWNLKGELGELYERIADAGPRTLPFFEADLTTFGAPAALAICRIGQVSDPGRATLRALFLQRGRVGANSDQVQTHSATFVALLKLGDGDFLAANSAAIPQKGWEKWYAAVEEKRGWTSIGPNNCQAIQAGPGRPSALAPGLVYQNGDYVEFYGILTPERCALQCRVAPADACSSAICSARVS